MEVEGKSLSVDVANKKKTFDQFLEDADMAVIDDAFKRAARVFSPDISRTYVPVVAARKSDPPEEEDYVDARADIAALGLVPEVGTYFDDQARKLADDWFNKHRVELKNLPHERQESYRQIKEMSREPQDIDLAKPTSWMEATAVREGGNEALIPTYQNHLMCAADGTYPAILNEWEKQVLFKEFSRKGFKAWYRNPNRASQESLGIAYDEGGEIKIVRPDFLFFGELPDGKIAVDVVDPHGTHLADALPKLKGLAQYAETHIGIYRRFESIAAVDGKMRVLDLTDARVRGSVQVAPDALSLFGSALAEDY